MWKKIAVVIILGMMIFGVFDCVKGERVDTPTTTPIVSPKGYTTHPPIFITGNTNFTSANGVTGGNGTAGNPYIIEGWSIDSGGTNYAISIYDTYKYFVVRNCYIYNGSHGITFYFVRNGMLVNNTGIKCDQFISLSQSDDNAIINNSYSGNLTYSGILLHFSSNNLIVGNTFYNLNRRGIEFENANNNNISFNSFTNVTRGVWIDYYSTLNYFGNNTFINGGICIQSTTNTGWSNPPARYNQIIDRTNTVNGKPIYYFHKEKGITIDGWSVAQIILSECSDFTIKNLNISYATIGIELAYSKNINVSDVVFLRMPAILSWNLLTTVLYLTLGHTISNRSTKALHCTIRPSTL